MRKVKERVGLRLDAELVRQAREELSTYGGTFTALVERALRAYLAPNPLALIAEDIERLGIAPGPVVVTRAVVTYDPAPRDPGSQ